MVLIILKSVRVRKNITIKELAELSGVSKSYISEIENNKNMPTIDILCKLAKALEVKVDDLYVCNYDE